MLPKNTPSTSPPRDRLAWTEWISNQVARLPAEHRSFIKLDTFETYGFTDKRYSRNANQDRALVAYAASSQPEKNWFLVVVTDGVGGSQKGELAASAASASMTLEVATAPKLANAKEVLHRALSEAHKYVVDTYRAKSSTTVVAFLVKGSSCAVGWIGDSRAYEIASGDVSQITQDDTLSAALDRASGDLAGQLSEEFAEHLSQAVGGNLDVKPNVIAIDRNLSIKKSAGYLLATDGVWKPLANNLRTLAEVCPDRSDLTRRLLLTSEWLGGHDNATSVLIPPVEQLQTALIHSENRTPPDSCVIYLLGGTYIVLPSSDIPNAPFATESDNKKEYSLEAAPSQSQPKPKTKSSGKGRKKKATTAQLVIAEEPDEYTADSAQPLHQDEPSV